MNGKNTIRTVGLITKFGHGAAEEAAQKIGQWLSDQGIGVWQSDSSLRGIVVADLPPTELVLVLGGDGTIISVSRKILDLRSPVVGINFGKVGFLAELTMANWQKALEKVIAEGVDAAPRMVLHFSLQREGVCIAEGNVINDVVINRGKTARLVNLDLTLNGAPLMKLRSDGLVMATPTGSTGYACSAGGALLEPTLDAYIVAAICPFLNVFTPMVLKSDTLFEVTLPESSLDLFLTLDGQESIPLKDNDILRVQGVSRRFMLADMGLEGYAERLRRAGFISKLGTHG